MAKKRKEQAQVLAQRQLSPGIYDCLLKTTLAEEAKPGQFIALYPKDKSTLLPRPISICEADAEKSTLRIVYRVVGAGTSEFSRLKEGDAVDILGVLGNGFPLDKVREDQTAFLMGGGIGVPPILELAKRLSCRKQIIVGYRDADCFLREDFEKNGEVYIATEDGSVGTKGNVMDAIRENALKAVRCPCFVPSSIMPKKRGSTPTFLWRSAWPAAWAPVLAACAKPRRRTLIPM